MYRHRRGWNWDLDQSGRSTNRSGIGTSAREGGTFQGRSNRNGNQALNNLNNQLPNSGRPMHSGYGSASPIRPRERTVFSSNFQTGLRKNNRRLYNFQPDFPENGNRNCMSRLRQYPTRSPQPETRNIQQCGCSSDVGPKIPSFQNQCDNSPVNSFDPDNSNCYTLPYFCSSNMPDQSPQCIPRVGEGPLNHQNVEPVICFDPNPPMSFCYQCCSYHLVQWYICTGETTLVETGPDEYSWVSTIWSNQQIYPNNFWSYQGELMNTMNLGTTTGTSTELGNTYLDVHSSISEDTSNSFGESFCSTASTDFDQREQDKPTDQDLFIPYVQTTLTDYGYFKYSWVSHVVYYQLFHSEEHEDNTEEGNRSTSYEENQLNSNDIPCTLKDIHTGTFAHSVYSSDLYYSINEMPKHELTSNRSTEIKEHLISNDDGQTILPGEKKKQVSDYLSSPQIIEQQGAINSTALKSSGTIAQFNGKNNFHNALKPINVMNNFTQNQTSPAQEPKQIGSNKSLEYNSPAQVNAFMKKKTFLCPKSKPKKSVNTSMQNQTTDNKSLTGLQKHCGSSYPTHSESLDQTNKFTKTKNSLESVHSHLGKSVNILKKNKNIFNRSSIELIKHPDSSESKSTKHQNNKRILERKNSLEIQLAMPEKIIKNYMEKSILARTSRHKTTEQAPLSDSKSSNVHSSENTFSAKGAQKVLHQNDSDGSAFVNQTAHPMNNRNLFKLENAMPQTEENLENQIKFPQNCEEEEGRTHIEEKISENVEEQKITSFKEKPRNKLSYAFVTKLGKQ